MEIPKIKIFLYTALKPTGEALTQKMLETDFEKKVIIVKEKDVVQIGGNNLNAFKAFFINISDGFKKDKVDENFIYEIMEQLTSDIDLNDLPTIS